MGDAVGAFAALEADYERHCQAPRALAAEYFDSSRVVKRILERALV
jgi:hypothetical protein